MTSVETDPIEFEQEEEEDEYEDDFEETADEYEDDIPDLRRDKLVMKPARSEVICGKTSARYDLSQVPTTAKLSLRRKSQLDLIMKRIPKPEGAIPRTALPTWYAISMNEKIPLVPAPPNYIYYSRGTMGQPLVRPHPFYTVWDQRNLERVVGAPYSALHDPHAKKYMSQPTVKSFIKKQGLINDENEVLCSLRDFNKFRDYLRTQYNDEVQRAVSAGDATLKWDRDQLHMIRKFESDTEGRQSVLTARRGKAMKFQKESANAKRTKIESKQQESEKRLVEWKESKRKQNLDRVIKGYEKKERQSERYLMVMHRRVETQRELLKQTTLKDMEVTDRRKNDQQMMSRALYKFHVDWIDSKLEYCKQRLERDEKLEESMREEIKSNAKKRQRRVEHYRAMMPALLEKKKQAKNRLWDIVRKYAMRWLDKVRKRLNAPKDVQHESSWIGKSKGVLDDTLKFLKELSGYEKMDDFVLNIIKLKKQIQQQIELEEAQEAAELAKASALAGESRSTEPQLDEDGPPKVIPEEFQNDVRRSLETQKTGEKNKKDAVAVKADAKSAANSEEEPDEEPDEETVDEQPTTTSK